MKTILAPTDYSQTSQNAVRYAAQLAIESNAQLVLFHVYHTPPVTIDIPVVDVSMEQLHEQALNDLKTMGENLQKEYGEELQWICDARLGFAADEINDYALESDVDLIVMGIQGSNFFSEFIVGSITTSIIKNPPCPVLVVGKDMEYNKCKKIVWACDGVKSPSVASLNHVREVLRLFGGSQIDVIHVINPNKDDNTSFQKKVLPSIQSFLKHEEYFVHHIPHEDVVEGINNFVKGANADMVIMAPRKHATWKNFFFEPQTKHMAFHAIVPLLIIEP